jgi:hypothetical protein
LRSSMVFTESEYGTERIIYPDGSTEEDDWYVRCISS